MKYLAIDFGGKRLGLALSENAGRLALPYGVHTRRPNDNRGDLDYLVSLIKAQQVDTVVFGKPGGSEASDQMARQAANFAEKLKAAAADAGIALEIAFWDERFSTAEVLKGLTAAGISHRQARESLGGGSTDARAAAVILEGYLESLRRNRQSEELSESAA
jgi:putative Holliday junction resolvase